MRDFSVDSNTESNRYGNVTLCYVHIWNYSIYHIDKWLDLPHWGRNTNLSVAARSAVCLRDCAV